MSYLDQVAAEIRRQVPTEVLPGGEMDGLFRMYAVLALAKGESVDAADVHNAWAAWMSDRDPDHGSLRPFWELDSETRKSDEPFVTAIREVAKALGREPAGDATS
jgi:hypothetical protein